MPSHQSYGIIPVQKTPHGYLFLLVHNARGHWGFPKGNPRDGETPLETATREFTEETGIVEVCINRDETYEERYSTPLPDGERAGKTVTYFLGLIADPKQKNGIHADVLETIWLPYEEALKKITYPEAHAVLEEVRQYLDQHQL